MVSEFGGPPLSLSGLACGPCFIHIGNQVKKRLKGALQRNGTQKVELELASKWNRMLGLGVLTQGFLLELCLINHLI